MMWSPQGGLMVVAALGKSVDSGTLEFWDVDHLEVIGEAEHFMATDIGEFVCLFVCLFSKGC
jgi:hypothetical protein